VIEVDNGLGPELIVQLRPGDELTGPFQQHHEYPERLLLKTHPFAGASQLAEAQVRLKHSESQPYRRTAEALHGAIRRGDYPETC
jgi:hypothetical protein